MRKKQVSEQSWALSRPELQRKRPPCCSAVRRCAAGESSSTLFAGDGGRLVVLSYGNAEAVESVESQRQASHTYHKPLGKLAKGRRVSHISTAPTMMADGKLEKQPQVFHFPTAWFCTRETQTKTQARGLVIAPHAPHRFHNPRSAMRCNPSSIPRRQQNS